MILLVVISFDLAYADSLTGINAKSIRRKVVNPGKWGKIVKGQDGYNEAERTVYQMINDDLAVDIAFKNQVRHLYNNKNIKN